MREPLPPSIRTGRAPGAPSPEVARVKALYLAALRRRIEDGSYMTEERVKTALARMTKAAGDDLPQEDSGEREPEPSI